MATLMVHRPLGCRKRADQPEHGVLGGSGRVADGSLRGQGHERRVLHRRVGAPQPGLTRVAYNRQMRRRRGNTDTVDAEAAARAVVCGEATAAPKSADGCVEAIRTLTVARRCAVKARTVAANQIDALVVTAAERLRRRLRALPKPGLINACARLRPDPARGPQRPPPVVRHTRGLDFLLAPPCERAVGPRLRRRVRLGSGIMEV